MFPGRGLPHQGFLSPGAGGAGVEAIDEAVEFFRRSVEDEDVALTELETRCGLPPHDALAPERRHAHAVRPRIELVERAPAPARAGGDCNRTELLAKSPRGVEDRSLGGTEDVAEKSVTPVAHLADLPEHTRGRHPQPMQEMGGEHETRLEGLGDDFRGPRLLELEETAVVSGAHEHREIGTHTSHLGQDLERPRDVVVGDDERPSARESEDLEDARLTGVAVKDLVARPPGLANATRIEIDGNVRDGVGLEKAGKILTDAPEPAEDHVLTAFLVLRQKIVLGRGDLPPESEAGKARVVLEQDGVEREAQHEDPETEGAEIRPAQHPRGSQGQEHESELPRPGQSEARAPRGLGVATPGTDDRGRAENLEDDHGERGREKERKRMEDGARSQLGAHGDEKEPEENVAERPDVARHLGTELGLAKDASGKEGAKGVGRPKRLGGPGGPERDEKPREGEELRRSPAGHLAEDTSHEPAPEDEEKHHREKSVLEGMKEGKKNNPPVLPEARDDDEKDEGGEILPERDHQREAPVGEMGFPLIVELTRHQGRRSQRKGTAEDRGQRPGKAEDRSGGDGEHTRLDSKEGGGEEEDTRTESAERRWGEVETEREEEENDAPA